MSDTKRILTVSYGAFSCTLEGFDDPIATLHQVTAHVSSLTARMPSFGAVPVTPAETPHPRQPAPNPLGPVMAPSAKGRPWPEEKADVPQKPVPRGADVSVSRLMQATQAALEDPQTQRRTAAMAQMKALVMAKIAERGRSAPLADTETAQRRAFQQDLDQTQPSAGLGLQAPRRRGQAGA